jgi:micrococcal nuclease
MRNKNKALILLIVVFVFLFLAGCVYFYFLSSRRSDNFIVSKNNNSPIAQEKISTSSIIVKAMKSVASGEIISNPTDVYYPVLRVVDGDTIDVGVNGKTERLRLIGINTPETVDPKKPVECFGPQASANAHKFLDGTEVKIAADPSQGDKDIYGRLLRYVWLRDGLFYNLEAIKDGFAFEYTFKTAYQYQKEFQAAQKSAQENKLGLWSACDENKIIATPDATGTAAEKCLIKGNISSSGVKLYELPGCPYYSKTVIDSNKGEKWFCTEAVALAAGWRKAGNCP